MAKSVTKKPAAAKAPAAKSPASAKVKAEANTDGLAVVNIAKDGDGPSGTIDVGLNGHIHKIKVGEDTPVSAQVAEVLAHSGHKFTTVTPAKGEAAGEGSSAASTIMGTAIPRDETELAGSSPGEPAHELSQVADADIVARAQGGSDAAPSAIAAGKE